MKVVITDRCEAPFAHVEEIDGPFDISEIEAYLLSRAPVGSMGLTGTQFIFKFPEGLAVDVPDRFAKKLLAAGCAKEPVA